MCAVWLHFENNKISSTIATDTDQASKPIFLYKLLNQLWTSIDKNNVKMEIYCDSGDQNLIYICNLTVLNKATKFYFTLKCRIKNID